MVNLRNLLGFGKKAPAPLNREFKNRERLNKIKEDTRGVKIQKGIIKSITEDEVIEMAKEKHELLLKTTVEDVLKNVDENTTEIDNSVQYTEVDIALTDYLYKTIQKLPLNKILSNNIKKPVEKAYKEFKKYVDVDTELADKIVSYFINNDYKGEVVESIFYDLNLSDEYNLVQDE